MTLGKISLNVGENVGEKSDFTSQKRKKSAKTAVKTAKKPVLRENFTKNADGDNSVKTSKKDFGGCRHLWTAADAAEAGRKGGTMKGVRAAILNDCARTAAANNRLNEIFQDALNEPDPELANMKMQLAERAAKFIGATFDQSPDAKQKIEVDGKMDDKLEVVMTKA